MVVSVDCAVNSVDSVRAVQATGVHPPEAAVDPDPFLSSLAQRGIIIHEHAEDREEEIP